MEENVRIDEETEIKISVVDVEQDVIDAIKEEENRNENYIENAHYDGGISVAMGYGMDLSAHSIEYINSYLNYSGLESLTEDQIKIVELIKSANATMDSKNITEENKSTLTTLASDLDLTVTRKAAELGLEFYVNTKLEKNIQTYLSKDIQWDKLDFDSKLMIADLTFNGGPGLLKNSNNFQAALEKSISDPENKYHHLTTAFIEYTFFSNAAENPGLQNRRHNIGDLVLSNLLKNASRHQLEQILNVLESKKDAINSKAAEFDKSYQNTITEKLEGLLNQVKEKIASADETSETSETTNPNQLTDEEYIDHVVEEIINSEEFQSAVDEALAAGQESDDNFYNNMDDTYGNVTITDNPDALDPLILDLDGDGIDFIHIDESTAMFDFNGDGFNVKTSWVSSDDAFVVLDKNNDGVINDISEMFGNAEMHGYVELSQYDSNNDGVIDSSDTVFDDLKLWRDLNQDGISQSEELFSFDELGVASINLNFTDVMGPFTEEGVILASGTFTFEDGKLGKQKSAHFYHIGYSC